MSEHLDCGCQEYNELSRRSFVAGAGAALAAAAFPAWLPRVVLAESFVSTRDVIVSVFMRGGADGLSLVVPFGDANYYSSRPTLNVAPPDSSKTSKVTALTDYFGLPPAMSPLVPAYKAGQLAMLHAVGNLTVNRSHFDMQRFIEIGKPNDPNLITGWLGRHLASVPPVRTSAPLRALGLADGLQRTLYGAPKTLPIADPANYGIAGSAATAQARADFLQGDYFMTLDPVRSAALDATNTLTLLKNINITAYKPANSATYPNSAFGRSLRSAAALIKADVGIEAVQIDIGGWDTHQAEDPNAGSLFRTMTDFATSLAAFWADVMSPGGAAANVTLIALSEFGRNVRENASLGTDHGRGGAMFVMGPGIAGGHVVTKDWPGLARDQQENGQDLRVTIDHRDVLAEVVSKRLGNTNLDLVFPGFKPTFPGVAK